MRVRLLLSVLASAMIVACSATNPTVDARGADSTSGGVRGDAGQPDAGDAGSSDAGVADAGNPCDTTVLPLGSVAARDNCASPGSTQVTTATIIPNGCNDVKIFLGTGFNCSGVLTGPSNAFNGTCSTIPCGSTALPGTLGCTLTGGSPCTIQVCADSTGTNCP